MDREFDPHVDRGSRRPVAPEQARFKVEGRAADRSLIENLAKHLAEMDADAADRLHTILARCLEPAGDTGASIVEALRHSPLVGADLYFGRERTEDRKIEL